MKRYVQAWLVWSLIWLVLLVVAYLSSEGTSLGARRSTPISYVSSINPPSMGWNPHAPTRTT